jgi:hypothetical protein
LRVPTKYRTVAEYLAGQTPEARAHVETLRALVGEAAPELTETIKWNSPNWVLDGQDLLTVNVGRGGETRLVLHRGTAVAERKGAAHDFDGDPHALLTWHSDIRASLPSPGQEQLVDATAIVRAWVRATPSRS